MAYRRPGPMRDMGVALLDTELQLRTADPRTLELLGAAGIEEGRAIWAALIKGGEPSSSPPPRDQEARAQSTTLRFTLRGSGRRLRVELRVLRAADREGPAALIQDETVLDALEQESRLADRVRGIFFFHRAMTHDLRGQLHNMALHIELLGAGPAEDETAVLRDRTGALKRALAQLSDLLDSLFVQTAPPGDRAERFDLRAVIDEVQVLLAAQAKHQLVTTRVRLPATSVLVEGRRADLRQAYLGAVINALQSMPRGGELSVTVDFGPDGGHTVTVDTAPAAGGEPPIPPEAPTDQDPSAGLRVVESLLGSMGGRLIEKSAGPPAGRQITMLLPGASPDPQVR